MAQTHDSSTNDASLITSTSADRLSFTVFLALAVHGLIIFGVTFDTSKPSQSAPSVTVTLAAHQSISAPEEADFLAQSNQIGSGSIEEAREITTDVIPPAFDSQLINDTVITEQQQQTIVEENNNRVIQSTQASTTISNSEQPDQQEEQQEGRDDVNIEALNEQIASLKAKLAVQRQTYAKIPRQRVLTSVSTMASSEAAYLNEWTQKIEAIGNQNFPREALRQQLTGQLRLEVVIKYDGTIIEINLKQSSGHRVFDESARQIVRQASPFLAFPPEIRKDYEHLVIIRTWHFNITGLTTSE